MAYNIQDIQDKMPVVAEELERYIVEQNISVSKSGNVSKESFQMLIDYFSIDTSLQKKSKEKDIFILNGNKVKVKNKPFFESQQQRVCIFHNDAISFLKGLPENSVDVIITDPAYSGMNQKLKLGSGKIIGKYSDAGKDDAKWFEEFHDTEENYKAFIKECHRVLKKDRHIYIMFDSYSLLSLAPIVREIFEVKNVICWDKANIGLGHYFRRRHEFILFSSKGKRRLNSKNIPDVWKIKRVTSAKYPTQKPTEIFELMLKGSAEKDFVVCDPFLGSGSAAIAAIRSDCKFIGCDISDKAIAFSKDRILQFLSTNKDPYQNETLLGDDLGLNKLFSDGQSK